MNYKPYLFITFITLLSFILSYSMYIYEFKKIELESNSKTLKFNDKLLKIDLLKNKTNRDIKLSKYNENRTLIPKFKRHLDIPELSGDSIECDQVFSNKGNIVECKINDGDYSCWNCIESRKYKRLCIHFNEDLEFKVTNGKVIKIEKNKDENTGYCLPINFKDIKNKKDIERKCSKLLGDWVLTSLNTSNQKSYNWLCKCKYPQLMTNQNTAYSNCTKMVACQGKGILDEKSLSGLIDPFINGKCECQKDYKSSRDNIIGPKCIPKKFYELDNYEMFETRDINCRYLSSNNSEHISPYLKNKLTSNFDLIDPCSLDSITKDYLDQDCCKLKNVVVFEKNKLGKPFGKKYEASMCIANNKLGCITTKSMSDYLNKNGGIYPNGCLKIGNLNFKPTLFSLSYFNKNNNDLPDSGILVNIKDIKECIFEYLNKIHENNDLIQNLEMKSSKSNNSYMRKYEDYTKWSFNNIYTNTNNNLNEFMDRINLLSMLWAGKDKKCVIGKGFIKTLYYLTDCNDKLNQFTKVKLDLTNKSVYSNIYNQDDEVISGIDNTGILDLNVAKLINESEIEFYNEKILPTAVYNNVIIPNPRNFNDNGTLIIVNDYKDNIVKNNFIVGENPLDNPFNKRLPKTNVWNLNNGE